MASSGLPPGAFRTTINGRRCTAVPKVAADSPSASSSTGTSTSTSTSTNSITEVADTTTTSPSTTTTVATNGLAEAPVAGIDDGAVEQSSSSTTSPSLLSTTSIAPSSVRVAQDQGGASASERPPTPRPAAVSPSDAASQSSTSSADVPPPPAPVAESTQADASITALATDTPGSPPDSPTTTEAPSPELAVGPVATPLLSTIESPQTQSDSPAADATGTTSTSSTPIPNVNNNAVQSTVAVAGGVIGGVVAISVLAFFIWWWRRRLQRRRRSTLLTPLDIVPSRDRNEKGGNGGYEISRGSIGPTPVAVKVKATLGYNYKKIRGHIRNRTAPSVNLDRGTSQFIDSSMTHSRANSGIIGVKPTTTDRLKEWWAGLGKRLGRRRDDDVEEKVQSAPPRRMASRSQPDFLTLLSMDTWELDREAQRRRASIARCQGSVTSADNLLGGLDLSFGQDNPFSDDNAITHTSAKPAPLNTANPFSDRNAIRDPPAAMPKPSTYVADIRRSRSNSTAYTSRDSVGSLRSITTATTSNQRNKFRSDPFDLERPELLVRVSNNINSDTSNNFPLPSTTTNSSTIPAVGQGTSVEQSQQSSQRSPPPNSNPLPPPAVRARTRTESFTSRYSKYSKYSSGVSAVSSDAGESAVGWGDPGPDVGPGSASGRWAGGASSDAEGQPRSNGGRLSGGSLGSLGSVGKAM
ncbi:hypothetical protein C7999DRAFT_33245 [Corynascus novoguineensis]|uniref:Uncharacterized protein n=1 Tax=Corynascus novoguineensis TaxID=1126955 RepID=A0AAN7CR19_9PEZI|nr:hypothetical protein C7999DRAFT_33245 [Corynascus novoguineensis]